MILSGVTGISEEESSGSTDAPDAVLEGKAVPLNSSIVLAGCNSLVSVDSEVVGDSMEKAALKGISWDFISSKLSLLSPPRLPL